ncbi:hypothetical protein [Paenibacillus bovis]|uniref:Glycosyl hydrolase n=1 Tax=Paenibacillus bovis TaxID=1616788 RepID=A0A172ZB58_9BACL|nr:hypothetical protein [Paenibacillus bovis]ANF94876.1 glycosyl hydrolase [Paenibacillus bovis]
MQKHSRHFKRRIWYILLAVVIVIAAVWVAVCSLMKTKDSSTAVFMQSYMTNSNGTVASYLKDKPSTDPNIVAGREALSESLGLSMQYALLSDDPKAMEQQVQLLQTYFLSPQHYIWWKLDASGHAQVNTNALGDDLRIVGALLDAYERWGQTSDLAIAREITDTLWAQNQKQGYLVDYHDFVHDTSSDLLSLTYVDIHTFQRMKQYGLMTDEQYRRYGDLLQHMPNDGTFYPRTYDVNSKQYNYDDTINLIDQLILGIHLAEYGQSPDQLVAFMKKEFSQQHRLYGRYDRSTHQPAVDYEAPAVYGLAIQLALRMNDRDWAQQLYERMIQFRAADGPYQGGYVADGDTHAFDNLIALLAETQLQQTQ